MIRDIRWFTPLLVFASLLAHDLLMASDTHAMTTVQQIDRHVDHRFESDIGIDNVALDTVSGQTLSGDRAVACSVLRPWTTRSQNTDVQVTQLPSGMTVSDGMVTIQVAYPPEPPGYPPNVLRAFLQVYRN